MNKTTLKQKPKKELLAIAEELGIKKAASLTIAVLIDEILAAMAVDSEGEPLPRRQLEQADENLEVKGASKKFEMQDKRLFSEPEYPVDESRELPQGYGDTKIVAMVRDPYWLYLYWEINHDKRRELTEIGTNSRQMVLRAHDVTGLGFNGFNAHSHFDIPVNDFTNNWYVQLPASDRAWCVDLGVLAPDGSFILIARSNTVATPRDTISSRTDDEARWVPTDENFTEMYRISGGYKIGELAGSEAIGAMLAGQLAANLSSGAVASSSNVPLRHEGGRAKDFWLVVNTELIVYGATEPDATVTLQGQPVKLRPDGTFTARFALPDGEQVIPVHATNADGDMEKEITPIVTRTTRTDKA